jgi:integrase
MQTKITKTAVDSLRPGGILADTEVKGFVCRRLPSGNASYGYRYRHNGAQRWLPLGLHGAVTAETARALAKAAAGERAKDKDPGAERAQKRAQAGTTVNFVLDTYLTQQRSRGLRSVGEVASVFDRVIRPVFGHRSVYLLTRRDVLGLLDDVEQRSGPFAAQKALAYLRSALDHWSLRDERYRSPLAVRGLNRIKKSERARKRILSDDELRDLWRVLDGLSDDVTARFTKALLLSGRRRSELAGMQWQELAGDLWIVPIERSKGKCEIAQPIVGAFAALLGPPQTAGFVFGDGAPLGNLSTRKALIDKALADLRQRENRPPVPNWRWHDLRRTARTLLSRLSKAGVPSDHAERVLGHKIGGVRAVYDVFEYCDEVRHALESLAALVERIVNPPSGKIVPLRKA